MTVTRCLSPPAKFARGDQHGAWKRAITPAYWRVPTDLAARPPTATHRWELPTDHAVPVACTPLTLTANMADPDRCPGPTSRRRSHETISTRLVFSTHGWLLHGRIGLLGGLQTDIPSMPEKCGDSLEPNIFGAYSDLPTTSEKY